ncbi:hypothetical protein M8C21_010075 [Ambrosia artemisiifolia]|uniref:Uncharacterized protein n=1 Tax=Ambrosia artemisiifolia TaxID=4212 RepID=A0AAD5GRC2_AMBAR|nr:hypothetical protein M8C21_010075 [Ambrosia artemisiifolia]
MVVVCTLLLRNTDTRGGQQGKLSQLLKDMAYKQSWIATRLSDYLASLIHGGGYCVTAGCEFCCFYYAGLLMVIVH